ncbi:MAG TPA: HD domain-containing protein [Bryobacteraceae bacterium]|nr:HD domain-containing protein [Bryobacteraceae bacterium]
MKSPYVKEVEPNRVITTSFLVHSKEIRQKKSGEMYLSLLLADKTGEIDAKMWDNVAEVMDTFDRDDFVKVKGLVQIFHNRPQLTIHKMRRMEEHEVDFGDYFPCSLRDPMEMWAELRAAVAGMRNRHLRGLLEALLDDPEIAGRYRRAPAAKQIHHAYLGGLLEHVLSLAKLARLTAEHYPFIDHDLLLTGVVVHDIGKIYELNYERGFSYSTDGQLLGHMAIALRMIGDKLRGLPDFPVALRSLVEHLILSHHGQLEFGSPKVPLFPEALLLHYIDDMDSKLECMRALIEGDRQVDGCFTTYNSALARPALKMEKYWNAGAGEPPAAANPPLNEAAPEPRPAPSEEPSPAQIKLPTLEPAFAAHPLFAPRPDSPVAHQISRQTAAASTEPKQEG